MITISILTLTIYLFGFLGSPREQRIASVAKTLCQKLTSNGITMNSKCNAPDWNPFAVVRGS